MKENDYFEKLSFADTIEDAEKKLAYLNTLQIDFNKIKEQDIDLSKIPFEDRISNVSLRLENLDYAYFDYALKTKIFLASLDKSE
ncbi:MAG: hypothetical protein WCE54_09970 [Ignavibacteriaceae bacterium]